MTLRQPSNGSLQLSSDLLKPFRGIGWNSLATEPKR